MLKILLAAIISVTALFQSCLARNKNFFLGFELGPDVVVCKSLPLDFLNENKSFVIGYLTPWAKAGYRVKGYYLMARFGAGGASIPQDAKKERYDIPRIYLPSFVLATPFLNIKRFGVSGIGGYQYSYFEVFQTNNFSRKYRDEDSGISLGIETRFNFKRAKLGGDFFVGIGCEYVNIGHPLRCMTLQVGGSDKVIGNAFIKFRYFNQKDIYSLYVLTAGGYWYLWF